jgi:hypothetical protein
VGLHAVLLQAGVVAELVARLGEHLQQAHGELFTLGIGDHPVIAVVDERVRRVHPVERLVGATVGMDGDATVGLHHDETHGLGEMGIEPTSIVDGATGYDETHVDRPY